MIKRRTRIRARSIATIPPMTPEQQKKFDELVAKGKEYEKKKEKESMEKSPYVKAGEIAADIKRDEYDPYYNDKGGGFGIPEDETPKKIETFKDLMKKVKK
jgi:hypothetical protein